MLSIIIAFLICVDSFPVYAEAKKHVADVVFCPHHLEHTETCGYRETAPEQPCNHIHDEFCGYV